MNLSNLKQASTNDVEAYLKKHLELSPAQISKMNYSNCIKFSPFYFYEVSKRQKVSFLWRLTLMLVPFYFIILYIGIPVRMIFTGQWGYGRKFIDGFHSKWMRKLKL